MIIIKNIKLFLLSIILIMCTGCNKFIIDELPKGYYIKLNTNGISVYSESKLKDIISDTNLKIPNKIINTNKVGTNTYSFKFKLNKKRYLYHIKYLVKDEEVPKIFGSGSKTFNVGYDGKLCDLIMYGDNYDKKPVCSTEGEYDPNTVGIYNIKFIVKDNSENEQTHNMTINIKEPTNYINNNSTKTQTLFNDIYSKHKNDKTRIGIDVSRWQGDINYELVRNSGASFVIMRIGVEQSIGENISMDSKFKQNIENAKKYGLDVGVYLYSIALNTVEAKKQALWVIDSLKGEKLDLPIVFDWESFNKWNTLNLSFHDINSIADTFIETIESKGYKGMLYSSKFYLENIWENKNEYPVWLAHYTNQTNYEGNYSIWQLCNDGKIDGIDGDVDIDVMYTANS